MGSYAQQTRPVRSSNTLVSWGGNVKIIHRKVGEFATAWGFGLDAGFKIRDYKGKWGFGVNARDITTTFNSWNFTFTNNQKPNKKYLTLEEKKVVDEYYKPYIITYKPPKGFSLKDILKHLS
jgi:hypothetical protein